MGWRIENGKINSVEYALHFIGQESEKGKVKENKGACFFVFFKSKKHSNKLNNEYRLTNNEMINISIDLFCCF